MLLRAETCQWKMWILCYFFQPSLYLTIVSVTSIACSLFQEKSANFNKTEEKKTIHHFRDKLCRKLCFRLNYLVINESHKSGDFTTSGANNFDNYALGWRKRVFFSVSDTLKRTMRRNFSELNYSQTTRLS